MASEEGSQRGRAMPPSRRRRVIVDAQVHLWKAEAPDRHWPAGGAARAQLPEPFTYDRLLVMMDEAGVDRAIIVPASWDGDGNDDALDAVAAHPDRFWVMGRIPLKDPQASRRLAQWKEQPGMLGDRLTFLGAQAARLRDETAAWFWPMAERGAIPVMVLAARMSDLAAVAERHLQLTLIIDHMGISGEALKEGRRAEAVADTVALAKYSNVSVKLSSAPAYSFEPYPFRDMTACLRACFDAYAPRRCYWGTRPDEFPCQGQLSPAHHPLHRRADIPLRRRQALDHGAGHSRAPGFDRGSQLKGQRPPGARGCGEAFYEGEKTRWQGLRGSIPTIWPNPLRTMHTS
jgi:predicted TIM-barrel fold metal-dependent hydrolase